MSRSLYKVPFVHLSCFENKIKDKKIKNLSFYLKNTKRKVPENLFFFKRKSVVNFQLLNKKIAVHNGYYFPELIMVIDTIGFRLGEFSTSRKYPKHKGKQKSIKRIVRKK